MITIGGATKSDACNDKDKLAIGQKKNTKLKESPSQTWVVLSVMPPVGACP